MILENFVVFEGIDGAGTSTQLNILKNRPESSKIQFGAEPTENETGKFLRSILGGKIELDPRTTAFLFAADRAEHVWGKNGILETIKSGKAVIIDRYIFSSLAYQGVSCGKELPKRLNQDFPLPELLFFFDIAPETSLSRIGGRGFTEIYENNEYLTQTRKQYLDVINYYKNLESAKEMKIVTIDATQPKEEISKIIWSHVSKLPIFNS
ncbi:dTMP kinase [Treponema sp.]|uniref:dTMP kinase n=1 Tax=Treponema sp. TaxID=166 RepID=UPI00298DBAFC|nr:dTMP kinase [Treponema sp.]MCR5612992.1 dTMP kinase [Treponema sp.]